MLRDPPLCACERTAVAVQKLSLKWSAFYELREIVAQKELRRAIERVSAWSQGKGESLWDHYFTEQDFSIKVNK